MEYSTNKNQPSKSNVSRLKKPKVLIPVLLILAMAILLLLELTNTTYLFHKKVAVSSTIPAVAKSPATSTSTTKSKPQDSTNSSNSTSGNEEKNVSPSNSGAELLLPSGSFVSSHRPSINDSSNVESICITTPGASCTITFTIDNAVKTLDPKKADDTGTVLWNWNIDKAGFTAGSWQIKATASSNGQSKSTTDIQKLEVQP